MAHRHVRDTYRLYFFDFCHDRANLAHSVGQLSFDVLCPRRSVHRLRTRSLPQNYARRVAVDDL